MYLLNITKIRYPKNDTNIYEYKSLDNLLMELKRFILDNKIHKDDIIRIEKDEKADYFIDEQYDKMKKYIMEIASEEELKRHFEWYGIENENRDDLLNSMFESYCNSYDDERLEKEINKLLEV